MSWFSWTPYTWELGDFHTAPLYFGILRVSASLLPNRSCFVLVYAWERMLPPAPRTKGIHLCGPELREQRGGDRRLAWRRREGQHLVVALRAMRANIRFTHN